MTENLKKAIGSFKSHIEQIIALRSETEQCLDEIRAILNDHLELKCFQLPESAIDTRPCILFIGSQNCGKSTLINVFLEDSKLLPTHETSCTSRIVRIVYSPTKQVKVKDPATNQEQIIPFKNKLPKSTVVLEGDARQDASQLNVIVEVGLNHHLLECGIELIDSPGRNENEALNRVVEEFIQKGIVPLIVYVIDGNYHLRDGDRTTIRELQDKFPNISMMFVCSKVDVSQKAVNYDKGLDNDEDHADDEEDSQKMFNLARNKKTTVFKQLHEKGFLPQEDQMDSSELFHGLSAKLVRRDSKRRKNTYATINFEHFQKCLLEKLETSLRKQSRRELSALLTFQEVLLGSAVGIHQNLTSITCEIEKDYKQAKEAEEVIFSLIESLISKEDSIIDTITQVKDKLSLDLLQDAQDYHFRSRRPNKAALIEFSIHIKGAILDKIFNGLRYSFKRVLNGSLLKTTVLAEVKKAIDPLFYRMLQRTLGNECHLKQVKESDGFKIHIDLEQVIDSVSNDVDTYLRNEIKSQLENIDINQVKTQTKPEDAVWRKNVAKYLLDEIDIKKIGNEVIRICQKALVEKRKEFNKKTTLISILNGVFLKGDLEPKLDYIRTNVVRQMTNLAVRAHSLRYVMERGPPPLGHCTKSTQHSHLYSCTSALWSELENSVVKEVKRVDVNENIWSQIMRDLMNSKDIQERLPTRHSNLLELRGWYFPEPDLLHIVMEKAECDLLTALKQGLSWKRRKEIGIDVAHGIEAIHSTNFVYQDLKADNILITDNGTAKINICKPEKPFETTQTGLPFHISPEMFDNYNRHQSSASYNIYAFGSLLWVLCDGSGTNHPKAYLNCKDIDAIKLAICTRGIKPERPDGTPDAWWKLMNDCWKCEVDIKAVLEKLSSLNAPSESILL